MKNQGTTAAGVFDIGFYLSTNTTYEPGTDIFICKRSVTSLAAGVSSPATDTAKSTCATPPVPSGAYYVLAVDDSTKSVVEYDETNNTRATAGTIKLGADLVPQAVSVSKSGNTLTLKDAVKNQGNVRAGPFTISFYLSNDRDYQTSDYLVCSRTVSSLAVSAQNPTSGTTTTTCPIPASVPVGSYYLIVVDDATNTVVESTESNNTLTASNTIIK